MERRLGDRINRRNNLIEDDIRDCNEREERKILFVENEYVFSVMYVGDIFS